MNDNLDFWQISRKELRAYILSHRNDEEALRIYMDRMDSEPGVTRISGGLNDEDFARLEQFLSSRQEKKPDS